MCVGKTIVVRVRIAVTAIGWVQAIADLPSIRQTVAIAVCVVHVCALGLFFGVGKTVAIPICTTVVGVQRVRSISAHSRCC